MRKRFLVGSKAIFPMVLGYINFINDNTAWAMPSDYANTKEQKRASYKEIKNGIEVEKGFKSEVTIATFKDNPDAVRGKDAYDLYFEEAGAFGTPGLLKASYAASEDCVKDGEIKTGLITIFGTSGDMEEVLQITQICSLIQLSILYYLWRMFGMKMKKVKVGKVGFFHPVHWNLPGFIDEARKFRPSSSQKYNVQGKTKVN